MTETNDVVQKVLASLPVLQNMVSVLHEKECSRLNKEVTHTSCVIDVVDTTIECARIESGAVPVIRISGVWALNTMFAGTTEQIVDAIRRGIIIAHKRLRWTLGKSKPRIAAEYVAKARGYRVAAGKEFTLPVTSFRTRVTVTMSDPTTGETETQENVRPEDVERVQRELAHKLTAKVYAHTQVAEVLDVLEGQKLAAQDPAPESHVDLSVFRNGAIQTISYMPYHDSEAISFSEATS